MKSIKKIADELSSNTIAAAKRALKEARMKQTLASEVLAAKKEVDAARAAKRSQLSALRQRQRTGRTPVLLPAGTPAQRLEGLRKATIRKVFTSTFRQPSHGETKVVLTDYPAKVGVTQAYYDNWNVYAKSYKYGPAKCLDTTVTVPLKWRTRVERQGIAVLNGMMTLDASPIEGAPVGVQLFAATWAGQGRGNSINVVNGFIAVSNGVSYHADTVESAMSGLKRKIKSGAVQAKTRNTILSEIVRCLPNLVVRLADARSIGACEYGIKSWCNRVGLSYEVGEATVAEVHAAYCVLPAPEARAAILHAARHARRGLK